jgi:hydrogenase expression/formation protein HypD
LGALLEDGTEVDGFICPGHVCSIIGAQPFEPVARDRHKPCVVAGFEPGDVLLAILMLVKQLEAGESKVQTEYLRGVEYQGNSIALKTMNRVFAAAASEWRGIGMVEHTGLELREEFSRFDASGFIEREIIPLPDPPGCRCGDVLRGRILPHDCPLFGKKCTPENPVGPCMVSSEGSCATYYRYAGRPSNG